MNRLKRALKKYGLRGTVSRIPNFARSQIKKFMLHPTALTRFGVSRSHWQKFQIEHELDFWENNRKYDSPDGFASFKEKYFNRNKNKFNNVQLDFPDGTVIDIGCGPDAGFLPFANAKLKIGLDPLANEYSKNYKTKNDILMIPSTAEEIPLLSNSVDACYCVNALDHMIRPHKVLGEIYRILKTGAYFAFSVDIGGTKGHPVKIYEKDLDNFFEKHPFKTIERKCSPENSAWGKEAGIPLYVFQGYKT
ncbi:MAG: class I SAM-dependent methyltransferase [Patescibacteria group bacterium]